VEVVAGGEQRADSVRNALERVETELVAIHDAARPLVTPELIEGVIATLAADPGAGGAIAATPVTDTIKRAGGALDVAETVDRGELWAAQTPQVFRVEALRGALAADPGAAVAATDESMIVEAAGGRVMIHPAPAENLKITTEVDLRIAEALIRQR
jgi:2-C-methyl-D-erythritol 4-phosphate cytidylyltransferase